MELRHKARGKRTPSHFEQYKQRARTVSSPAELLPGLNDISDAFEALPMDLIKYFTLLKEIDAKCINTIPQINGHIKKYLDEIHGEGATPKRLETIGHKIHEIIPCLEEKMHVTTVATDVLYKHMHRINNDYQMILANNEIPESIRIGPLNHPAMIMDSNAPENQNPNRSAQSTRSESRREALAAKKVVRDDDDKKRRREGSPQEDKKKKQRSEEGSRSGTPAISTTAAAAAMAKKRTAKPRRDEEGSSEPTYCYCNQVSFGEMVGCDGADCKREWFHLPCIGFKNPPKGRWYCDDCLAKMKKRRV